MHFCFWFWCVTSLYILEWSFCQNANGISLARGRWRTKKKETNLQCVLYTPVNQWHMFHCSNNWICPINGREKYTQNIVTNIDFTPKLLDTRNVGYVFIVRECAFLFFFSFFIFVGVANETERKDLSEFTKQTEEKNPVQKHNLCGRNDLNA